MNRYIKKYKQESKTIYFYGDNYNDFNEIKNEFWEIHKIFFDGGILPVKIKTEEDGRILMQFGHEDDGKVWFNNDSEFVLHSNWCLDIAKTMIELHHQLK